MDDAQNASVEAIVEIDDVLNRFCVGVDRMDWDLLGSCFHSDAQVDFGAFVKGPISDYLAFAKSPNGLPSLDRTMHNLGSRTIEVEGDVAHADTYCVAYHSAPEDHPWCNGFVIVWARYLDRFERREGRWAISRRVCSFEWAQNQTTGVTLDLPAKSMGRRDRTDEHYRR